MLDEQILFENGASGLVRYTNGKGRPLEPHRHKDQLEFNFIACGRAIYLVKDRQYEVFRHSIIWLLPGEQHMLADCSQDFEMWNVTVGSSMDAGITRYLSQPGLHISRILDQEDSSHILQMVELIYRRDEDKEYYNAGLNFLFHLAYKSFKQSEENPGFNTLHPSILKAISVMEAKKAAAYLDLVAEEVGLSREYLSRLFRKQVGISFTEYKNRVQIGHFFSLIENKSSYNITDAAYEAGFGSYSQFYKVFRQVTGFKPAWLKNSPEMTRKQYLVPLRKTDYK